MNGFEVDFERDKARTYQIYEEISRGKLFSLPSAIYFIKECISRGLKMAVASSADKVKVMINLREIGLSVDNFQTIVIGEDVELKRPFSDIYIKAAKMIGLKPQECLVVEDAVSGVKAGKAAEAKCLALTTSFPSYLLTEADWICENLNVPAEAISW